jgi:hypothetical protein
MSLSWQNIDFYGAHFQNILLLLLATVLKVMERMRPASS